MFFNILSAFNLSACNLLLTLDKRGNTYIVNVEDKTRWASVSHYETKNRDEAESVFYSLADAGGYTVVKETDTSGAYSYIASQHD